MSSEKGKRPVDKKETLLDTKIKRQQAVQVLVESIRKKLEGKRLVPHPDKPKTYIYI